MKEDQAGELKSTDITKPEIKGSPYKELNKGDKEKGIGWKIYLFVFIAFGFMGISSMDDDTQIALSVVYLLISSIFLYSWIMATRIQWLSSIYWLAFLWSLQFFIAPLALIVHGYFFLIKNNSESLDWIIRIIVSYPGLYAIYRLVWKSKLLQQ